MRLIAHSLELIRNERILFSNLGFELGSGEALALVGPNGAGKSSLLRALLGFLYLNAGTVKLEGADEETLAEATHYIAHADGLKTALTAGENLSFWAKILALRTKKTTGSIFFEPLSPKKALEKLRLDHIEQVPVAFLSAGQRRRVALARLLVAARPIWFLDEPTTALDAATVQIFAQICAEHLENGGLILAATHLDLGFKATRLEIGGAK